MSTCTIIQKKWIATSAQCHAVDAKGFAGYILKLADDPELCRTMGRKGAERVAKLCNGRDRAADLLAVWRRVARKSGSGQRSPHP